MTIIINDDESKKLDYIATKEDRSRSSAVRVLINKRYEELKKKELEKSA